MKNILLIIISVLVTSLVCSQSIERHIIGSTGGEASNATVKLSFTVGESVVKTFTSGSVTLTQGFQQASDSVAIGIKEIYFNATYKLYPNPTEGTAKLELLLENYSTGITIHAFSANEKLY